jgi:hypothetical protein
MTPSGLKLLPLVRNDPIAAKNCPFGAGNDPRMTGITKNAEYNYLETGHDTAP